MGVINVNVIVWWRMRWTGHVARMGRERVQGLGGKARRKETT
jgi:hypothetical protein